MNPQIKNALLNGRLVLLLGAGASKGCTNKLNTEIPLGSELARILAEAMGENYSDEDLSDVYGAAKKDLGLQVNIIFEKYFKHCTPSKEYIELVKYPFFRIYSLNIDDALEKAAHQYCKNTFNVKQRFDCISEVDQFYQTLDYIKLNGDINYPSGGFIFSPQEYGAGSAKEPLWYDELARDFYKYTFIFIGTKLKEPLFYHQIEKYKAKTNSSDLKSYILIPELTNIQKNALEASNIHHIEGKLSDFIKWLGSEFETPPTHKEIIANTRPELNIENTENSNHISLFSSVTPVSRATLALLPKSQYKTEIREFYKGFKPTWFDITDEVPAFLANTRVFFECYLANDKAKPLELFLMLGSAGCGKSTALKQLALKMSDTCDRNVYFVEEHKDDFQELIAELDHRHKEPYYLFIERIGDIAPEIADIIKFSKSPKAIFVSAENPKIWSSRVKEHLNDYVTSEMDISLIDDSDADLILEKIEKFGNWTRLARMSQKKRKVELLNKSKKQLLIGLLEATSGEGYKEIIKRDYKSIDCEAQKALLILAGLAATNRVPANEATLTRALSYLNVTPDVHFLASQMEGVLKFSNGNVTTRHRVYMEQLLKLYVPRKDLLKVIEAYIRAFSVYQFPVVRNISRNEGAIYKYLVNAKSLKRFLDKEDLVTHIYERFEKIFENEGLFLMQYGLALRSFGRNDEAYEKLRIAHQAFPESPQIEHALAQQRIILACQLDDETIAMAHFNEAEKILKRLNSPEIRVFDRYPIITLSEGHVKVLNKFDHVSEARIVAKMYHDLISKNSNINANSRIKMALSNLAKYSLKGVWPEQNHETDSEFE